VTHVPQHANTVQHAVAIAVAQTCLQIHFKQVHWVSVSEGHASELARDGQLTEPIIRQNVFIPFRLEEE
jgi:hypothetical protein